MPARAISITNHHPRLRLDRRALVRAIHTLDANHPAFRLRSFNPPSIQSFASGELSLVFLTDPELSRLHADFLADPTPTDVITFEGDSTHGTAGEICVSVDAAWRHTLTGTDVLRCVGARWLLQQGKATPPFRLSLRSTSSTAGCTLPVTMTLSPPKNAPCAAPRRARSGCCTPCKRCPSLP